MRLVTQEYFVLGWNIRGPARPAAGFATELTFVEIVKTPCTGGKDESGNERNCESGDTAGDRSGCAADALASRHSFISSTCASMDEPDCGNGTYPCQWNNGTVDLPKPRCDGAPLNVTYNYSGSLHFKAPSQVRSARLCRPHSTESARRRPLSCAPRRVWLERGTHSGRWARTRPGSTTRCRAQRTRRSENALRSRASGQTQSS